MYFQAPQGEFVELKPDVSTLDLLQSVGEQQQRRQAEDDGQSDGSLLTIITAQRDRLIEKVNQLQEVGFFC